jgi:hypothetical protein
MRSTQTSKSVFEAIRKEAKSVPRSPIEARVTMR